MKKITAILFTLMMVLSFTACTNSNRSAEINSSEISGSSDNSNEALSSAEIISEPSSQENSSQNNLMESNSSSEDNQDAEEGNILVAYFSATNTTEGISEQMAEILNADLYEITPVIPYTDADLNYHDDNSRSTIEMNDPNARPEISGSVEHMEQYETILIGYPIWWGEAPRIVSTFMESYDFSGKTIIPFCTSGGSGIGSSAANLAALTNGADWLSGQRFLSGASRNDIIDWINELGLEIAAE